MLNRFQIRAAQLPNLQTAQLLAVIILLAVLLRVAIAFYLGNIVDAPPLLTDQRAYHGLGARLVAGYGFSFNRPFYPFTPANTPTAHWSFLYALFVAVIYRLAGINPLAVRLIQAILAGILFPYLTYRLAQVVFNGRDSTLTRKHSTATISVICALIVAMYPYFVLYAATVMTESLYICAVLWSLERSLRIVRHLQDNEAVPWPVILTFGLSLGVATLLRQSFLPWVPILFLFLLFRPTARFLSERKQRTFKTEPSIFFTILIAGLILLSFVLPWTIRNYIVYGDFLLLNSNTGYAMYSAQHPMHGTHFREFDAAPLPDGLPSGNEAQLDRILLRQGLQFIVDDPGRFILLSFSRVRAYFEFWPTPDTSLLHNVGRTASFGLFLPFMLYGLVLSLRDAAFRRNNMLLYIFVIFYSLLHILTWAMVRYRLPVDAILILFAALAFSDLRFRLARWLHVRTADSEPADALKGPNIQAF